jgi:hypothetical protein
MPWFLKPATCSYKFSFIYTTCSYFCLNIFSVVLCNISVNQQSFLKKNHIFSIHQKMPWFLKPATCSYKFSFIYTVRLGYWNFIFRKLANHQCLFWCILNMWFFFKKLCWLTEMLHAAGPPDFFSCTACAQRYWHWHRHSHALIYFRKISSYWLWIRTLNSNKYNWKNI